MCLYRVGAAKSLRRSLIGSICVSSGHDRFHVSLTYGGGWSPRFTTHVCGLAAHQIRTLIPRFGTLGVSRFLFSMVADSPAGGVSRGSDGHARGEG